MDNQGLNNQNPNDQQQEPQAAGPVSVGPKEHEPAISVGKTSEYLTPSETPPEIPQEARDIGVEDTSEKHPFKNVQHLGVKNAGHFVEPNVEPEGKVKLPMTESEIQQVERKEGSSNSVKWFASLIKKAWKKIKGGNK
jgi:hypothetical protein